MSKNNNKLQLPVQIIHLLTSIFVSVFYYYLCLFLLISFFFGNFIYPYNVFQSFFSFLALLIQTCHSLTPDPYQSLFQIPDLAVFYDPFHSTRVISKTGSELSLGVQ